MTDLRGRPVGVSGEIISIGFEPSQRFRETIEPLYAIDRKASLSHVALRMLTPYEVSGMISDEQQQLEETQQRALQNDLNSRIGGRTLRVEHIRAGLSQTQSKDIKSLDMTYGLRSAIVPRDSITGTILDEAFSVDVRRPIQLLWRIPVGDLASRSHTELHRRYGDVRAHINEQPEVLTVLHPKVIRSQQ